MVQPLPTQLYVPPTQRPPLRIAHWQTGDTVYGSKLVVRGDMTNPDAIKRLEALVDGVVICNCDSLPFYLPWKGVQPGSYLVGLRATLHDGTSIEAEPVRIQVASLAP